MTGLEGWLKQATRSLSKESAAQVRAEIQEHHDAAREAALLSGTAGTEADAMALRALGDAKEANCAYRKVLLTSSEARTLREVRWEGSLACANSTLRWQLTALPVGGAGGLGGAVCEGS